MNLKFVAKCNEEEMTATNTGCLFDMLSRVQSWIEGVTTIPLFIQSQPHFDRALAKLTHTGKLDLFSLEHQVRVSVDLTWVEATEQLREAEESSLCPECVNGNPPGPGHLHSCEHNIPF